MPETPQTETTHIPAEWPAPRPEQVQVLLLGTYHMDNPGLDKTNIEADDVLTPNRQDELTAVVDGLERFAPARIAVERPYARSETVNELYREYRDGDRTFDTEYSIEPPHPERDNPNTECRSEVVQIGFRLAARLGHERVVPIDFPAAELEEEFPGLADGADELNADGFEPERKVPVKIADSETTEQVETERLQSSTIVEYLRYKNREERLAYNHDGWFDMHVRAGRDDNLTGPRALGLWYERNVRMVHYLWREMDPSDERLVFVVGSGHIRVLRHLLDEAPMFCPVSPLPYLS